MKTVMTKGKNEKLTITELAEALYEGLPHLQNLAENLARQHGKAEALSFFNMMGEDIQNFWMGIAKQLINHAKEWEKNENTFLGGSSCRLSDKESKRLHELPRIKE